MSLTGKTISELTQLTGVTSDTLFLVEKDGLTRNIPYSGFSNQSYKVYTALLTQSGTSIPITEVLENTIGNISLTRDDDYPGEYGIVLDSGFSLNKTFITGFGRYYGLGSITWIPIIGSVIGGVLGYYTFYLYPDNNTIYSQFIDLNGNRVDLSYFGDTTQIPIEIRVYN